MAAHPLDPQTKGLLLAAMGYLQSQLERAISKISDDNRDLKTVLTNLEMALVESCQSVIVGAKTTP